MEGIKTNQNNNTTKFEEDKQSEQEWRADQVSQPQDTQSQILTTNFGSEATLDDQILEINGSSKIQDVKQK